MKLKDTTYNDKYPKFDIRKMDDEEQGVPFGKTVTLKLVDTFFEWQGNKISGPLLVKEIPYNGSSFIVNEITASVVGDTVENIKYNAYGTATFNINDSVAKKILTSYPNPEDLGGMTLDFTLVKETKNLPVNIMVDGKEQVKLIEAILDEEGNVTNKDDVGKWEMADKTFKTFQVSVHNEDGSKTILGKAPEKQTSLKEGEAPNEAIKTNAEVSAEMEDEARAILDKAKANGIQSSAMSFDDFYNWIGNDDDSDVQKLRDLLADCSDEAGLKIIKVWFAYVF